MDNKSLLSKLALLACCLTFCVIGLGAYTRLIDAGLGCPDWPGCYGQLTVPSTTQALKAAEIEYPQTPLVAQKAWAEMLHRYLAGTLSLVLVILLIVGFRTASCSRGQQTLLIGLMLLIFYQILLGRLTVTWKLLPLIVTQHLLGGILILSLLWLLYQSTRRQFESPPAPYSFRMAAYVGAGLLFLQIFLGAWTSTHYASLSCPDFPFCGKPLPLSLHSLKEAFTLTSSIGLNYEGGRLDQVIRETIQMVHRMGALIITLYLLGLATILNVFGRHFTTACRITYYLLTLLCLQLFLGMMNVLLNLPRFIALGHTLVAALLLLTSLTLCFQLSGTHSHANQKN